MTRKKVILLSVAALIGISIATYIDRDEPTPADFIHVTQPLQKKKAPPLHQPYPKEITLLPTAKGIELYSSAGEFHTDLSNVHVLLSSHRRVFGENPVGLNDEITAELTGRNSKGVASLSPDHRAISDDGELLDRWSTPYRFHALSSKLMEVRSAGPDRVHFTEDDLTLTE